MKINYDLKFKEELEKIKDQQPTLLLHVCCGPCSSNVLKEICNLFKVTIYYSNSNIYPDQEYYRRYHESLEFIEQFNQDFNQNITVIEKPYLPQEYLKDLSKYKDEPEGGKRCYLCYQKRMDDAYNYASIHHFDYWTTVLSVSPHKNSQWINEIGASYPSSTTKFLFSDFKKNNGYLKSVNMAREYNLYRQSYCGCVYSYQEMLQRKKERDENGAT
ncbi:epoxyqueuosine reductase QueH [Thomasclavelia sp.]|uniref:epoxyqueuosine reductase QueH n=1 Tax=Thomasclavelia sp. TaxID=3025757 RepID=UPI0025E27CF0|nr:epoxyqueuosine reductase QueH [Thomasclavelia sp.]